MIDNIIIGNIVAFIGSIIMVYTGLIKEKKKLIFVQTIQIGLFVISNFVTGGITGGIINILCLGRNILSYKEKLGFKEKVILTILSIGLSVPVNTLGIYGLLPVIGTVAYIWLMNTKDILKFKWLVIFNGIMWLIYDAYISLFVSAVFDFMTIGTTIISMIQIKFGKKNVNDKKEDKDSKEDAKENV